MEMTMMVCRKKGKTGGGKTGQREIQKKRRWREIQRKKDRDEQTLVKSEGMSGESTEALGGKREKKSGNLFFKSDLNCFIE